MLWKYNLKLALLLIIIFPSAVSYSSRTVKSNKAYNEFTVRQKHILSFVASGRFSEAIPLYRAAAIQAQAAGYPEFSRKFLNNLGACQLATFHYGAALKTLMEVRILTENAHDTTARAALDLNLSSLYLQMGNLSDAAAVAEEGISLSLQSSDYRAKLLIVLANVRARMGRLDNAEKLFLEGIDDALQAQDNTTAAWGWDYLGFAYRKAGQLNNADRASTEGFRLRKMFCLPAIESSYWNLGMIHAQRGDFHMALVLLDRAVQSLSLSGEATPAWSIYGDRGKVQLRSGNLPAALADLRIAVSIVREWRINVVANDANRTASESGLAELYSAFIETGNRLYMKTHDSQLAHETFEAAEENRAASLRALVPQPQNWRNRLPNRYWDTLVQLQLAERAILQNANGAKATAVRLRSILGEMEAAAGSTPIASSTTALRRTQFNLDSESALFSFYLDDGASWVWSVTRKRFALHILPPRKELATTIRQFEHEVHRSLPRLEKDGLALYRILFGSIESEFVARDHWFLALDRDLFSLPFAVLNPSPGLFLAQVRTIQTTSGALLLQPASIAQDLSGPFLAVGDPIYNHADARSVPLPAYAMHTARSPLFARLWGSGMEVRSSAKEWGATKSLILLGADATKSSFWALTRYHPSVIHIATHILEEQDHQNTDWIVLSLGSDGEPEYLTPVEIAAHSISARIVVLSGCSSGDAEVRTASGLMGLTRAWIASGAGAVLATRWPTIDDNGEFFDEFYSCLRNHPSGGPAAALRAASMTMMKLKSWRSQPSFWGTFFIVGN